MQFSPRQVWIDAICINQSDLAERGHQVGLMPKIYSRARNVLMYVGEDTPHSSEFVRRLSTSQPLLSSNWMDITSRRYFTRLWTLQEVALARRATLVCGKDSAHWSQLRQELNHLLHLQLLPPVFHFDHSIYSSPNKLMELLLFAQTCQASDPRDKVFGLLGLLPSGKIGDLGADYNMSVEDVYIRVALHLVSHLGWMSVLHQAGLENRDGSLLDFLPSWVPDWSTPRATTRMPPPPKLDLRGLTYNEPTRSITLKLLRAPALGYEFHEWEEQLAAQCSSYLFFPGESCVAKLMLETYITFSRKPEYPLWKTPVLPCGFTSTRVVPIYTRQIGPGRHLLHNFEVEMTNRYHVLCVSMEAAVQLFAFKSYFSLFNSSWQNVLADMVHRWNRASTANGDNTLKDRLDLRLWAPDSTFNEFLEVLKELPVALEPSNGGVEEDSCGDLEGLWMRKFLANELEGLKSQDMANDVPRLDEPSCEQILQMNDSMWRLLVRCCSMKEVTLEIV
jgi:hypothetical protein